MKKKYSISHTIKNAWKKSDFVGRVFLLLVALAFFVGLALFVNSCLRGFLRWFILGVSEFLADFGSSIGFNAIEYLTALVACITAYFAYCAFRESINARKTNTFMNMLTTLIGNQSDMFNRECLLHPQYSDLIGPRLEGKNAFTGFVAFCDSYKHRMVTAEGVYEVWEEYGKKMRHFTEFNACFSYVYNEIATILKQRIESEEEEKYYVGLVKAVLDKDMLFCYLVNLTTYFTNNGAKMENITKYGENETVLKKYGFFEDLLENDKGSCRIQIVKQLKRMGDIQCVSKLI